MNLFLLGGNNKKNEAWIRSLSEACKDDFETSAYLTYSHWSLEKEMTIDIDKEVGNLVSCIGASTKYALFAKSAGILVALKGIAERKVNPVQCIFAGCPVHWARANNIDFKSLLASVNVPVLVIQKTNDPACSAEDLRRLVIGLKMKNCKIREIRGDTHDYDDMVFLKEEIRVFCELPLTKVGGVHVRV